jgi:hypothetical protein
MQITAQDLIGSLSYAGIRIGLPALETVTTSKINPASPSKAQTKDHKHTVGRPLEHTVIIGPFAPLTFTFMNSLY